MSNRVSPAYDRHKSHDPDAIHGDKAQTGDICPWCGEPIAADGDIVGADGEDPGEIQDWPVRVFHRRCYAAELAEQRADQNKSLEDFTDE